MSAAFRFPVAQLPRPAAAAAPPPAGACFAFPEPEAVGGAAAPDGFFVFLDGLGRRFSVVMGLPFNSSSQVARVAPFGNGRHRQGLARPAPGMPVPSKLSDS